MNKMILCEGETDAILLSYYLGKAAGWKYCKKPPMDIAIKPDAFEQSINWYERKGDRLLICGVGGKDNMGAFFQNKIRRTIIDAGAFSRMAVVLDRDKKEIESIEAHAAAIFKPVVTAMANNQWIENRYVDAFGEEQVLETLLVVIPSEHEGALETVMMEAISEDPYDAVIVRKAGDFVKKMRRVASKYISSDSLQIKSQG